jgi:hypothetical protein
MSAIVWQATVTEEMVAHLNSQELSLLVNELNDVVAEVCENYDIN